MKDANLSAIINHTLMGKRFAFKINGVFLYSDALMFI